MLIPIEYSPTLKTKLGFGFKDLVKPNVAFFDEVYDLMNGPVSDLK